jgi:hypothetical protein
MGEILRASAGSRVTIALNITGREVLVDRLEAASPPHGIIAKVQIEGRARDLAACLRRKGVGDAEAESLIEGVLRNEKLDLSSLCDFLDTACIYSDSLRRPEAWIGPISSHVAKIASPTRRSLEACRLFDEARSAQGTDRERILLRSLEP